MRSVELLSRSVLVFLALLVSLGCSSDRVRVYPVRGMVTFEGKPMAWGGSIAFVPLGNQKGKAAGGEIMPDGSYQLSTYGDGDGSMVGDFRVVITQVTHKEPENTGDDAKAPSTAAPVLGQADHIPLVYADSQKSPLTAKVEAKSLNEINFDLKQR